MKRSICFTNRAAGADNEDVAAPAAQHEEVLKKRVQFGAKSASKWPTLLCILLVLVFTSTQAVHFHSGEDARATSQCTLCLVTHSAVVSLCALPSAAVAASHVIGAVVTELPQAVLQSAFFEYYSRPPPAA